MEKWEGTITFNEYSINATILFIRPGQFNLGEWNGYGKLEGPLSKDLLGTTVETNIGVIIINRLSYDSRDIEFVGTGSVRGPLAIAMGIEK